MSSMSRVILPGVLILIACLGIGLGVADAQVAKPGDFLVATSTGGSAVVAITPNSNTFSTTTVPTLLKQHQLVMILWYFCFVIPCLKCLYNGCLLEQGHAQDL